jgi:hypothetical protein
MNDEWGKYLEESDYVSSKKDSIPAFARNTEDSERETCRNSRSLRQGLNQAPLQYTSRELLFHQNL